MKRERSGMSKKWGLALALVGLVSGISAYHHLSSAPRTESPSLAGTTTATSAGATVRKKSAATSPVSDKALPAFKESPNSLIVGVPNGRSPLEIEVKTGIKILTAREVRLEEGQLSSLVAGTKRKLKLHLFAGVEATVIVDVGAAPFVDGHTLYGIVEGDDASSVSLVSSKGLLVGTLAFSGKHFQIQSSGEKTHYVMQIDPARYPKTAGEDSITKPKGAAVPASSSARPGSSSMGSAQASAPPPASAGTGAATYDVIKLLVLYTPTAKTQAGGDAAIAAEIQNEVNVMNQAVNGSGVAGTIQLVAAVQTSYEQDTASQAFDLYRMTDGGDGFGDEAASLRKTHQADLVMLYTATYTNSCGIGFYGDGDVYHSVRYGYTVAARNCNYKWTVAHELGHNFGGDHDPANASQSTYTYARGYVGASSLAVQMQDIMAYDSFCFNCQRQRLFSNPNSMVNGYAVGSATQDNARRINETMTNIGKNSDWPAIVPGAAFRPPGTSVTLTVDTPPGVTIYSRVWKTWNGSAWVDVPAVSGTTLTTTTPGEGQYSDFYVQYDTSSGYINSWVARVEGKSMTDFSIASWDSSYLSAQEGKATTASVTVTAPRTPVTYKWLIDGVAVAGQTSSTLTFTPVRGQSSLQVEITNATGTVKLYRGIDVLIPAAITSQPVARTVVEGNSAFFSVGVEGNPFPTFQWQYEGVDIPGETNGQLSIAGVSMSRAGNYRVIVKNSLATVASNPAALTVTPRPPSITQQPVGTTVTVGSNVSLSVTVAASSTPLTYQWTLNNVNVAGATTTTLALNNIQANQAGAYRVRVTNTGGTVTSAIANVVVTQPPAITQQPANVTAALGGTASFTVVATGAPAPTYQWRFNGTNIAGATAALLSLSNLTANQEGTYSVVVTNSVGSVTSNNATLSVIIPPSITQQPAGVRVNEGSPAQFSVVATGTAPLAYQWRRNGTAIAGATSATHQIAKTARAQSGTYSVTVTNAASTASSAGVVLDVLYSPTYTTQPMAMAVQAGEMATFTIALDANPVATLKWYWVNPISGAVQEITAQTSMSLQVSDVQFSSRGEYFARATNSVGTLDSQRALLNVGAVDRAPAATGFMDNADVKVERTGGFR